MKCWKSHCQNEVKVFCQCVSPWKFSCAKHFIEHIDLDEINDHQPSTLYKKPASNTKIGLINELERSSVELTSFKNELTEKVTQKIQTLQNLLNKALSLIEEISSKQKILWEKLERIEIIPKFSLNPYEELLNLPIDKALWNLKSFTYSVKHLNFTVEDILTAKWDLNLSIKLISEWDPKEIVFFRNNSKTLTKIDLQSFKSLEKPLELEDNAYQAAISMCQVPGKGLFCYGNHPGKGTAYILHPDYSIEKLESGPPSGNMSAAFYEDSIYLFGGWDPTGNPWNKAFKYSLQGNNWMTISELKENDAFISNIVTDEGILLVGYLSAKLYRYDIECDSYFELASFTASTCKILCHSSSRNFLIQTSGDIYENNPRCLSEWAAVEKFTEQIGRAPVLYSVTYDDSTYFLDESLNLFRFNFKKLNLKKITIQK